MLLLADPDPTPALIAVGGMFLLATGLMVFIVRFHARRRARREANWRKFALENRLQIHVDPGNWLKPGSLRVSGEVAGLSLELSTYTVKVGKHRQEWARANARGHGPAGSFSVREMEFLDHVGGLLGSRDIELGNPAFDKRFKVKSAPESLVGLVLDPPLQEQIAKQARVVKFSYVDGEAEVAWMGGNESVEQLSEAVELHARLFGTLKRTGKAPL